MHSYCAVRVRVTCVGASRSTNGACKHLCSIKCACTSLYAVLSRSGHMSHALAGPNLRNPSLTRNHSHTCVSYIISDDTPSCYGQVRPNNTPPRFLFPDIFPRVHFYAPTVRIALITIVHTLSRRTFFSKHERPIVPSVFLAWKHSNILFNSHPIFYELHCCRHASRDNDSHFTKPKPIVCVHGTFNWDIKNEVDAKWWGQTERVLREC